MLLTTRALLTYDIFQYRSELCLELGRGSEGGHSQDERTGKSQLTSPVTEPPGAHTHCLLALSTLEQKSAKFYLKGLRT